MQLVFFYQQFNIWVSDTSGQAADRRGAAPVSFNAKANQLNLRTGGNHVCECCDCGMSIVSQPLGCSSVGGGSNAPDDGADPFPCALCSS